MRSKDEMKLLPNQYYIGLKLSISNFKKKADLTGYQIRNLHCFLRGSIEILYSVNSRNFSPFAKNAHEELQILKVQVLTKGLLLRVIKKLTQVLQRSIPYQTILIFSCEDEYILSIPQCRKGKHKNIMIVDKVRFTDWMPLDSMQTIFESLNTELDKQLACSVSEIINNFLIENESAFMDPEDWDTQLKNGSDDRYMIGYTVFERLTDIFGDDEFSLLLYENMDESLKPPICDDIEEDESLEPSIYDDIVEDKSERPNSKTIPDNSLCTKVIDELNKFSDSAYNVSNDLKEIVIYYLQSYTNAEILEDYYRFQDDTYNDWLEISK